MGLQPLRAIDDGGDRRKAKEDAKEPMTTARRFLWAATLACLATAQQAPAMTFSLEERGRGTVVRAEGAITAGDAGRFTEIAGRATRKALFLGDSPGGSIADAMLLALEVRRLGFDTIVTGLCASACAMVVYPAGKAFLVSPTGYLGFHSCHDPDEQPVRDCNDRLAEFAAENGFPWGNIASIAASVPPGEMLWFSGVLAPCFGMDRLPDDPDYWFGKSPCSLALIHLRTGGYVDPRPTGQPSFDCSRATTAIEKLICGNSDLIFMDSLMGRVYRMHLGDKGEAGQALRQEQRAWIERRDQECRVTESNLRDVDAIYCVAGATYDRMRDILVNQIMAGLAQPATAPQP